MYDSYEDALKNGWEFSNSELPTCYSYWFNRNTRRVLCEDELIKNWKYDRDFNRQRVRTIKDYIDA